MDHSTNPRVDRPRTVEDALRGLEFPAPRGKVIEQAQENNAAPEVMAELLRIPETADFLTAEDLRRTLERLR